jgi:pantoate--beta-alanine ligase
MRVLRSHDELSQAERPDTRAVVMTMGALHEGHLALVRRARELADQVLVTIFVNPLQFNDPVDLERYPRTLEDDCALLASEGVDLVYAPEVDDLYPDGEPIITVGAGRIGEVLEGAHRPGHFDGMLTVVLKLLVLADSDVALFGQKDAQQLIAIRRMCRDFNIPVEIVAVPTVREPDGLALSSRNRLLSRGDRKNALALSEALLACAERADHGDGPDGVLAAGYDVLARADGVVLDYLAVIDPASCEVVPNDYRGEVVIAVAAKVGATRLIDNMPATIKGGRP